MIPINVKGCVKEILKSRVVFKKNGRTAIISKNIDKVKKCIGFIIPDIYNFVGRTNVIDKKCINVIDVQSVKGLEFDTVYVFMDGLSEEEKYVSLTRGLHNLYVAI